jgi:hypothetical protein
MTDHKLEELRGRLLAQHQRSVVAMLRDFDARSYVSALMSSGGDTSVIRLCPDLHCGAVVDLRSDARALIDHVASKHPKVRQEALADAEMVRWVRLQATHPDKTCHLAAALDLMRAMPVAATSNEQCYLAGIIHAPSTSSLRRVASALELPLDEENSVHDTMNRALHAMAVHHNYVEWLPEWEYNYDAACTCGAPAGSHHPPLAHTQPVIVPFPSLELAFLPTMGYGRIPCWREACKAERYGLMSMRPGFCFGF